MNLGFKSELASGARQLGIDLSFEQMEKFTIFEALIEKWSQHTNLISANSQEELVARHLLDSLSCLVCEHINHQQKIVDVGSGAGLPGIPVKIARPQVQLTLLEASKKRVEFLKNVVDALELENVKIENARAESFAHQPSNRGSFDIGLARAVAPMPTLLEYVLPLVKINGYFIAHRGPKAPEEVKESGKALKVLGGKLEKLRMVRVPFLNAVRYLVVIRKEERTSDIYPRRIGVPLKRPIQGKSQ